MAKKQPAKPKARPSLDCDPIDDEEQPPFTLDDDGNMVLRRAKTAIKPKRKPRKDRHGR